MNTGWTAIRFPPDAIDGERCREHNERPMESWQAIFLPAAFGSAIQELAYWWQLRFKLSGKKYKEQMRRVDYWVIVLAHKADTQT